MTDNGVYLVTVRNLKDATFRSRRASSSSAKWGPIKGRGRPQILTVIRGEDAWAWWAESGCGKSTTGAPFLQLYRPDRRRGALLRVRSLTGHQGRSGCAAMRRRMQMNLPGPLRLAQPAQMTRG